MILKARRNIHGLALLTAIAMLISHSPAARADGIYRNGVGARAMSLGGTDTAWAPDALGSMAVNPAGLGFLTAPDLNFGLAGAVANGRFDKPGISNGGLDSSPNAFPEAAFALPLLSNRVVIGLAIIPDALMSADWHYNDPPGGLGGVSYGFQENKSQITVLRTALGVGMSLDEHWSLGASIGLLYNENTLKAPYIFQTTPGLAGAKTLLDLNTSGWGVNAQFGVMYKPTDEWQFGASYTTEATVHTDGDASGDAGVQLGLGSTPFHYDAKVVNRFPQMASVGASWKFHPQWRVAGQVDWINWGGAFKRLPVDLSNGQSGGILPASLSDSIPLDWSDEFVYRLGVEYAVTENLSLRTGYSYGASPVPNSTLSPLTAAIIEQTFTAGIGYHWSRYTLDLGYQYDLPKDRHVGTSALLSGEYSNSTTSVNIHWLALTLGVRF